jgi:ubiquinone/menaquinone biosynthesis C-methylase UbiE
MRSDKASAEEVLAFWNSRGGLGQWAGTRDVLAKQLEIEAIAGHVRDGLRILELGCGNGITAMELARRYKVEILGIDYAQEMITAAQGLMQGQQFKGTVSFRTGDVRQMPEFQRGFDLIYTERVFINLPDWNAQRAAIEDTTRMLAPGGAFVMLENSQDGLERINELRARVGLPRIDAPWHNRYLRDDEVATLAIPGVTLERVQHYSSTYYFLSRVVNAALAAQSGTEPDYDSPVNKLALSLPPMGEFGQGRIWLWRKK